MAIAQTVRIQGPDSFEADLTSADGDTTAALPHGLTLSAAEQVSAQRLITPTASYATAAAPNWAITLVDGTNYTVVKTASAGSGAATARVAIRRPHSIGQ